MTELSSEEEIKKEIERLQLKLKKLQVREKIEKMSSEVNIFIIQVIDENPYSRLMALKKMGIVENYEKIREFSIGSLFLKLAIVGKILIKFQEQEELDQLLYI